MRHLARDERIQMGRGQRGEPVGEVEDGVVVTAAERADLLRLDERERVARGVVARGLRRAVQGIRHRGGSG